MEHFAFSTSLLCSLPALTDRFPAKWSVFWAATRLPCSRQQETNTCPLGPNRGTGEVPELRHAVKGYAIESGLRQAGHDRS